MRVEIRNRCSDFNSYRASRVKSLFNCETGANFALDADIPIDGTDWKVGVIVGPSGSGKTSIGRALWPDVGIYDGDADWPVGKPIVGAILPEAKAGGFDAVTNALAAVGLGSVPAWLRPYAALSNGERFRAGLARVIAEARQRVVIDEFTSVVDRQIAKVGAAAFSKSWKRGGGQAVLLSCHYDVLDWIEPDWVFAAGALNARTMPRGIDLIVAAHSHDFIGERTRLRARFGGIGYHPSLLPLHRGRDAVRWAVRLRERVTGGSVYRLSNRMDGGAVLEQRPVFIRPDDDAQTLWRRELAPLGVELLAAAVGRFARDGFIAGREQDEALATWEPSIDRPPAFRPDLLMLAGPTASERGSASRTADDDTLEDIVRGGHAAYVLAHAKRAA